MVRKLLKHFVVYNGLFSSCLLTVLQRQTDKLSLQHRHQKINDIKTLQYRVKYTMYVMYKRTVCSFTDIPHSNCNHSVYTKEVKDICIYFSVNTSKR